MLSYIPSVQFLTAVICLLCKFKVTGRNIYRTFVHNDVAHHLPQKLQKLTKVCLLAHGLRLTIYVENTACDKK